MQRYLRPCTLCLLLTGWLGAQEPAPYTLNIAVDEVSLTFHAADARGASIDDLRLDELRVEDNGKPPDRIVSFTRHRDLPLRAGILVDTSPSVLDTVSRTQHIAAQYVERQMRVPGDSAFVMRFDSQSKVTLDWTRDRAPIMATLGAVLVDVGSRIGGTTLFDSVYKACRDQFRSVTDVGAGNFILLFSDGVDNASHARLEDDIRMCQSANTSIYAFSTEPKALLAAGEGQKTLRELAAGTGGHIFFEQTEPGITADLESMDRSLRSQYRLVYKPRRLKRDGSFHHIKLTIPGAGATVTARTGYYAPRPTRAEP